MCCREQNIFFNCLTQNFKLETTGVFRNHTTFLFTYATAVELSNFKSTSIPDLFFQNDFKHRQAASNSSEFMWEFFFPFPPHLPPMSISPSVSPHPSKIASE